MMTLDAPSGVTRIGGANVYAAKLATVRGIPFRGSRFNVSTGSLAHFLPSQLNIRPMSNKQKEVRKERTNRYAGPP